MTTREYLAIYKKYPSSNNEYPGWEEDLEKIKAFNKELINKYPWLLPRNRWTGEVVTGYSYDYTELDSMPNGWRVAFGDQMIEEIHQQLVKFDFVDKFRIAQIKEKWGGLRFYYEATPVGKLSEDYTSFTRKGNETLKVDWDVENYCLREDYSEHYISYFDRDKAGMTSEEIDEYNKDAIHHYRLYKILEKCTIQDIIEKYENLSFNICIGCGKPAEWVSKGWVSPFCTGCANKMINDKYGRLYEIDIIMNHRLDNYDKRGKIEDYFTKIGEDDV